MAVASARRCVLEGPIRETRSMVERDESLLAEIERDVLAGGPVADALRKCVVLGGRSGSTELRDWATKELRGYESEDTVPAYRTVGAPIFADALTGNAIVRGQRISPSMLPDFAQEHLQEAYTFMIGIGEIEALAEQARAGGGQAKLSLPMALDLARVMDSASGNPFQQINALYWGIGVASLDGIVDQVKTTVAQLVGELRAATPAGADVPSEAATTQAVHVAVYGKARNVTVSTAGRDSSPRVVTDSTISEAVQGGFWTTGRKVGAAVVGLAGIVSAVLTGFEVWGSPF